MPSQDFYGASADEFIRIIIRIMQRPLHRKALEASRGELGLLVLLSQYPQGLSAGELKDKLNISSSGVANTLKQAEQKGLVIRTTDEADHRRVTIRLTESGMQQAQEHSAHLHSTIDQLMQTLGQEDSRHLIRIFQKVMDISDSHSC